MIELMAKPGQSVLVHDVPVKLLSKEKKTIAVKDRLFILPNQKEQLTVVETLPLAHYLAGVLPAEIYPSAPLEALKAQAIIARTFTLSQLWSHYALEPFYTCVTTQCQVYHGSTQRYPSVEKAIGQTRNYVLKTAQGDFAKTFYHASSGGITDQAQVIFSHSAYVNLPKTGTAYQGQANDFLSKQTYDLSDPAVVYDIIMRKEKTYCNNTRFSSNADTWERHFSGKDLQQIFGSPVLDMAIDKRSISGRAISLRITTKSGNTNIVNELNIRKKLQGLPSSLMVLDLQKNAQGLVTKLHITGRGRGHGVGLSQMGAIGRAQAGQNHQQILRTYYPNTILSTILP
ncbi:MAG: SpoIID/LytB domain-containing protein [Bdellovibrionota bacterium]